MSVHQPRTQGLCSWGKPGNEVECTSLYIESKRGCSLEHCACRKICTNTNQHKPSMATFFTCCIYLKPRLAFTIGIWINTKCLSYFWGPPVIYSCTELSEQHLYTSAFIFRYRCCYQFLKFGLFQHLHWQWDEPKCTKYLGVESSGGVPVWYTVIAI
jgi:hypothetical protein